MSSLLDAQQSPLSTHCNALLLGSLARSLGDVDVAATDGSSVGRSDAYDGGGWGSLGGATVGSNEWMPMGCADNGGSKGAIFISVSLSLITLAVPYSLILRHKGTPRVTNGPANTAALRCALVASSLRPDSHFALIPFSWTWCNRPCIHSGRCNVASGPLAGSVYTCLARWATVSTLGDPCSVHCCVSCSRGRALSCTLIGATTCFA